MQNYRLAVRSSLCLMITLVLASACGDDKKSGGGTDAVAAGKEAVKTRACATCHAASDGSLSGPGTPITGTKVYAKNLTPDKDTGLGEWTEDMIAKAILTGMDDEDESLCSDMPRFKDAGMTDTEAHNIATYLLSLTAVNKEIPESTCSATVDAGADNNDGG